MASQGTTPHQSLIHPSTSALQGQIQFKPELMIPASFPARCESPIAQKCKQLFQTKPINAHLWQLLLQRGKVQCLHFTSCLNRFVVPRKGAALSTRKTASPLVGLMLSDFTTPAHKLLSASANPLPSPGQGKTRLCLHLPGQPQPLLTHRRAAALLGPVPVPTQPTAALAPASAIPAMEAVHILYGHHKLGQTKPTPGYT